MSPRRAPRRSAFARAAGLALGLLAASALRAQAPEAEPPVSLLADSVAYDAETETLTAAGDVEVLYQGRILRAARIEYDQRAGEIRATGPIVLVDPETGVMLADSAALTPDLTAGLVQGARVLIADRLQLAAVEARRRDGRFAQLDRVVASSCTICAEDPTPTWAIRAARVIQDEAAERIYFENARLEVFGLPVAWAPRLSIPDPRVRRASGFLAPNFLSSQIYGFGVKQPYYRTLGPSADMTVTPFATSAGGFLVEGEYRRRFAAGGFDLGGVIALDDGLDDDLSPGGLRWTLDAVGEFDLRDAFVAEMDVNVVSDDFFLSQFDYSDADLLTSMVGLRRTRAQDDFSLRAIGFQSLIDSPDDGQSVPVILPEFAYRRAYDETLVGGRLGFGLGTLGVVRETGTNMLRGTAGADWTRAWTAPAGVRVVARAGAAVDAYQVWDDPDVADGFDARLAPDASVELRWPLVRRDSGADHVIEPIVQLVWSDTLGEVDVPNEDSELPEFSYTNLFSLNRFPGRDRLETGLRANIGVQYLRDDPDGWNLGLTFGRVARFNDFDQFPEGTGLDGRWSDYVGEVSVAFDWGLTLGNRTLVSGDADFTRNEFAVAYEGDAGGLGASYIYLAADDSSPFLGPQPETSELALAARYRVRPNWEVRGNWRYDAVSGKNIRAGGGITYGNECAEIDLSVSRRYTSSDNLPPSTTIGFGLRLAGLGASESRDWPPRTCAIAGNAG